MDNNSKSEDRISVEEHFKKTQLVPYCIIIVVGILANTMVIVNGIRRRNTIKHYINYFVLSIAFADSGVVVMQVPIAIFEYTLGIPNISQFTCKYVIQTRETFQGAAIFSVSLLAFVRVRQVMSYPNKEVSRRACIILIAGIWLMSYLSCTLPLYFIYEVWPDGHCDAYWSNQTLRRAYSTFIFCIILSPMIIATTAYTYVIIKIRDTFSSIPNEGLRRRNRNVTVLLISLILSCWITYVPLAVFIMLQVYTDADFFGFYGWSITAILYASGSALNPVLVLVAMPCVYRCHVNCARRTRVDAPLEMPQLDADNLKLHVQSGTPCLQSDVRPSCLLQPIKQSAIDLV